MDPEKRTIRLEDDVTPAGADIEIVTSGHAVSLQRKGDNYPFAGVGIYDGELELFRWNPDTGEQDRDREVLARLGPTSDELEEAETND